jgi:hypothetical protein
LSELLWLGEQDGLGFDRFSLEIAGECLNANLEGAPDRCAIERDQSHYLS